MGEVTHLEQAIWHTLRYFALLKTPLTTTQLWRYLLMPHPEAAIRWEGHAAYSLSEVEEALADSEWLSSRTETKWGYYFPKGHEAWVEDYLRRHAQAQQKWKILDRVVRRLAWVPFVRLLAGSGSLAMHNTGAASDLDVFVVVRHGHVWLVRLLLLSITQLFGRRRTRWEEAAPDKVCLNHYVTDESLTISPDIHNVYTAMLYTHLLPLFGADTYTAFQEHNAAWMKRLVMYHEVPALPSLLLVSPSRTREWCKRQLEAWLSEPLGQALENWAGRVQRRLITRHTLPNHGGRVLVSDEELAFHPHTKVTNLLNRFAQDEGQKALL